MPCVRVPGKLFCKLKLTAIAKAGRDSSDLHSSMLSKARSSATKKKWPVVILLWLHNLLLRHLCNKKCLCVTEFVTGGKLKRIYSNCFLIAPARISEHFRRLQIPTLSSVNHLAHLENVPSDEWQILALSPKVWIHFQVWQSWQKP